MAERKHCLHCDKELTGRADKKYCDDYCRASYHSVKGRDNVRGYMSRTNKTLKKNRQILHELCPDDKNKVLCSQLVKKGFDFNILTSIRKTEAGKIYHYCYEMGYLIINEKYILIVKNRTISRT